MKSIWRYLLWGEALLLGTLLFCLVVFFLQSREKTAATEDSKPTPRATTPGKEQLGAACKTDADCAYEDGICLTEAEGFPGGMCSKRCETLCTLPNNPQSQGTQDSFFCVDASLVAETRNDGLCLSAAERGKTGPVCPEGLQANLFARNKTFDRAFWACAPKHTPQKDCATTEDQLIDLPYPESGKLWIPKELACGGSADLLLLFAGDQESFQPTPNLGGGNSIEKIARTLIQEKKSKPVLLAEVVENKKGCALYDSKSFVPGQYLQKLQKVLSQHKLSIASLSLAGHSDAACCLNAGLYGNTSFFPSVKVWGKIDGCYKSDKFDKWHQKFFAKNATTVFTMQSPERLVQSKHFETLVGKKPDKVPCKLTGCYKNPSTPWYSFQSSAVSHEEMPKLFVREVLSRFFAP